MNTYAIPALKEKRALTEGRILSLEREIARLQQQLESLDATISLFDPSYQVGSIRPKNPRVKAKLFKHGALGRLSIDALRRANGTPLSTKEVVTAVTVAVGQTKVNEHILASTVRSNLAYLTRRGKVLKVGKGMGTKWRLTDNSS